MPLDASTPTESLGKSSLTDRLTSVLRAEIDGGELQPGQRLPTGQEMARRYGVSLTVVREAISSLKADGVVETRQGSGAFVSRTSALRPFRIGPGVGERTTMRIGAEQIFELRTGVEVQASALAATRGSDEQLARIRAAFDAMQAELNAGRDGVSADIVFHRRIAEAAGNSLFGSFLDFLGEHIRDSIQVSREDPSWAAHQLDVMAEHRAIMEAICARDADAAREAAYRHMDNCLARCLP